jgi:hypothetical protein
LRYSIKQKTEPKIGSVLGTIQLSVIELRLPYKKMVNYKKLHL